MNVGFGSSSKFFHVKSIDSSSDLSVSPQKIKDVSDKIYVSMSHMDSDKLLNVRQQILCLMQYLTVIYSINEIDSSELGGISVKLSCFLNNLLSLPNDPEAQNYDVFSITKADARLIVLISQDDGRNLSGLQFTDSVIEFLDSINVSIPKNNADTLNDLYRDGSFNNSKTDYYIKIIDAIGWSDFKPSLENEVNLRVNYGCHQADLFPVMKEKQLEAYLSGLEFASNNLELVLKENQISSDKFITNWIKMGANFFDFRVIHKNSKDKIRTAITQILEADSKETGEIDVSTKYFRLLGFESEEINPVTIVKEDDLPHFSVNLPSNISEDGDVDYVVIENNNDNDNKNLEKSPDFVLV